MLATARGELLYGNVCSSASRKELVRRFTRKCLIGLRLIYMKIMRETKIITLPLARRNMGPSENVVGIFLLFVDVESAYLDGWSAILLSSHLDCNSSYLSVLSWMDLSNDS
jgi:hypothetical protein